MVFVIGSILFDNLDFFFFSFLSFFLDFWGFLKVLFNRAKFVMGVMEFNINWLLLMVISMFVWNVVRFCFSIFIILFSVVVIYNM